MLPVVIALLAVGLAVGLRLGGASDLGQNTDQSKTIAFTADAVLNGEWLLPRDAAGARTLKPPFINWLGMPPYAMGFRGELGLKLPALVAGLATAGLTWIAARALFRRLGVGASHPADQVLAGMAGSLGVVAGAAWICSTAGLKHVYFLRPDVLQAAFLTAGWFAATIAAGEGGRRRRAWLAAMWLAAGLAALSKGPLAVLIPLYAAALALTGAPGESRMRRLASLGWWYGPFVMLALPAVWLVLAATVDRDHVMTSLLGTELGDRIERGSTDADLTRVLAALGRVPAFMVERFSPWAPLAVVGVIGMGRRLWRHPLWPAPLWVLIVMAINVAAAGGSGSPLLPAYGPLAILGVYGVARLLAGHDGRRARVAAIAAAGLALVSAAAVGGREAVVIPGLEAYSSRAARTQYGDRIVSFAEEAGKIVGDSRVEFVGTGRGPLPALMGRARLGDPTPEAIASADWVIAPLGGGLEAVLTTDGPLRRLHAESGETRDRLPGLGLYDAAVFRSSGG